MNYQERLDTVVHASALVLQDVYPALSDRVYSVIYDLAKYEGLFYGAQMGLRSMELQAALYAQGRQDLTIVNALRYQIKLAPLTQAQNVRVTGLKVGFHNFGLAVDLVEDGDLDKPGVQWSWKNGMDYLKIGKYAKAHGLQWGGLWSGNQCDKPHVELTGGLGVLDCYALFQKGGEQAVWDKVTELIGKEQ